MVQPRRRVNVIKSKQLFAICTLAAAAVAGCRDNKTSDAQTVVVYCSVDEQFARQVLDDFEKRTGIKTKPLFDTEAGKTTGLVRRIETERDHPRADVFFSSEVFNTIRLAADGLLTPYEPPTAADVPAEFRDDAARWTGLGLRARVIAYNTKQVSADDVPTTWQELADPKWKGKIAIANPLFGTTRGHVAAMRALWGQEAFDAYLAGLRANDVRIVDGNMVAMRLVASGDAALCATDTDDARVMQASGAPVAAVFPDMGNGGTLVIPCTVALVAGGPHPAEARALVDFLVSADVERLLAKSDSGNIPVRAALCDELGMTRPPPGPIDFDAVAEHLDDAPNLALERLRP